MKIAVIKLGAKGDVVRTLCILPAIKKKYLESDILWITKQNIVELLDGNPYISRLMTIPLKIDEEFDILYSLDPDKEACELASKIKAKKKLGFYSDSGYTAAFNSGAEYYVNTMFDDELKKNNKRTYQEMIFDAAELPYNGERYKIYLNDRDREYASEFVRRNGVDMNKIIGIHMGSSPRWPSKVWAKEKIKEFIKRAKGKGYEILLFGGPDEVEEHKKMIDGLKNEGVGVYQNDVKNSDKEFAALINICKKMICSDSFSLHASLALGKPTVGLFFCTPPNEIEEYGLLKKIISPMLCEFFPERQDQYNEKLTNSISVDEVIAVAEI